MKYRKLGQTGLEVSAIGLGTWQFSGAYGAVSDEVASATVQRALERGITCFDTAPIYAIGRAEEILGAALRGRRSEVVVVTKCGMRLDAGKAIPTRDASTASIFHDLEASLARLRTDYVDVLLVHWPDPDTPLVETMTALDAVVKSGKARFVGLSNFTVEQTRACMAIRQVDAIQVGYHLFDRRQESEMLPYCAKHNVGFIGYGSLAFGLLGGAFSRKTHAPDDAGEESVRIGQPLFRGANLDVNLAVVERLKQRVASPRGLPLNQLSLAWVLRSRALSTALVGARSPAEVDGNIEAANVDLADHELDEIDRIMSGAAGRVREFTPLRSWSEPWGDEIPPRFEAR